MFGLKRNFKNAAYDILSLFSASFVGQLIHILILPFLSSYFPKNEIGAFFFFQALITMGAIFVSLQSELAIVVEGNNRSYSTFKKSIIIVGILSALAFLLVIPAQSVTSPMAANSTIGEWLWFVPLALFLTGINKSTEYLFTYEKRFKLISWIKIARPVLIYLFIFLLKAFTNSKTILITGFIEGLILLSAIQFFIIFKNKLCRFNRDDFSGDALRNFFVRHKKILVFNTLSTGIAAVSMQMPYVFINAFYGETFSAYYGMALRIIGMPLGLLGQSVGQVYFQKFSQLKYYNHSLYPVVKRLISRTYAIGLAPLLLLLFCIPWAYHIFLGPGWEMAVQLSRIVLPWLFVLMVSAPVSNIISVIGIQVESIYYGLALLIFRFLGLYLCSVYGMEFLPNMTVFSIIGTVFGIFFQYYLLRLSLRDSSPNNQISSSE